VGRQARRASVGGRARGDRREARSNQRVDTARRRARCAADDAGAARVGRVGFGLGRARLARNRQREQPPCVVFAASCPDRRRVGRALVDVLLRRGIQLPWRFVGGGVKKQAVTEFWIVG